MDDCKDQVPERPPRLTRTCLFDIIAWTHAVAFSVNTPELGKENSTVAVNESRETEFQSLEYRDIDLFRELKKHALRVRVEAMAH